MTAVVQDEQFVGQLTNEDTALGCQGVTPGHHSVKRLCLEVLRVKERCVGRLHGTRERDVDGSRFQCPVLHAGRHFHQRNLHVLKTVAKLFDEAGKKCPCSADKETDGERPDLAPNRFPYIRDGSIRCGKHRPGILQKLFSVIGEANASVRSIKEIDA